MGIVHNGVLLPPEMVDAAPEEKDAYAIETREINGAFCRATFALEKAAMAQGLTLDDIDDLQGFRF
jgi:hypothetical protein